jgi:MscS family membrane protein
MHALRPALALSLLLCGATVLAQDAAAPAPAAPSGTATTDASQLSPRSAMRGFLAASREERWDAAASYLNLANLPPRRRATQGPDLARKLKTVLDRKLLVDLESLSAAPEGNLNDGQPEGRDLVGVIETSEGPVKLYVERSRGEDDELEWRISRPTVDKVERLYDEFGHQPPFADRLPPFFFTWRVLDTALWQWLGLVLVAAGSVFGAWILCALILPVARAIVRRIPGEVDDAIVELSAGPLRLTIAAVAARAALPRLWLPVGVQRFVAGVVTALLVVAATWFVVRMVAVVSRLIQLRMAERGNAVGISAIPLVRRVVNAFVVLLALVLAVSNLGINMTGIIAGLGVGGLAVALAAQKSLENLFGGITLIMDQPVHVGDFCRFGDKVGTVEDIGLRSTRIRTLDRTMVTIPNAEFSSMQIENYARRDRIGFSLMIGVRYETTPDQLRYLLIELKRMLLAHPKIDPDPARVRLTGFGVNSLDLTIFAYVRTTDHTDFLAVREDVLLRIMEVVEAAGTGFAFPSQTVYESTDGFDREKARAAEEAVRRWREAGTLALPDLPPAEVAKVSDTLDYPPKGSATERGRG